MQFPEPMLTYKCDASMRVSTTIIDILYRGYPYTSVPQWIEFLRKKYMLEIQKQRVSQIFTPLINKLK